MNDFKLTKTTVLASLLVIIIISQLVGHFFEPNGILGSPIVVVCITGFIFFTDNGINLIVKSLLCYLAIGLNDIGIKLFAAGIHDSEGMGWIYLMLIFGLVPSLVMVVIKVAKQNEYSTGMKILSLVIFLLLMGLHLEFTDSIGLK